MTWNDHDHRGQYADERHDHDLDCAEKHHRHYDVERDVESAKHGLDELRAAVRELREQLEDALGRIAALEGQTPEARQLQLEAGQAVAGLRACGYVEGLTTECRDGWHHQCPPGVLCDCECRVAGADQSVSWAKPGEAEAAGRGEGPCAETGDGMHCGEWHDGGRCGACGLPGPQPDDEPEPEEYDPGPEAGDEGGELDPDVAGRMWVAAVREATQAEVGAGLTARGESAYRYLLPEDHQRGQS